MEYEKTECLKNTDNTTIWKVKLKDGSLAVLKEYRDQLYPAKVYSALKSICHDHLASVIDSYKTETGYVVVEAYIDGVSLQTMLDGGKIFSQREVRTLSIQLCGALKQLHRHNLVHRDVKPSNILLRENKSVVLIDYNAMRLYDTQQDKDTKYLGTEGYAAPEQYGFSQTDKRTDIYGLGATMYELLTGQLPDSGVLGRGSFSHIVKKCVAFSPDLRYQSITQLEKQLKAEPFFPVLAVILGSFFLLVGWGVYSRSQIAQLPIGTPQQGDSGQSDAAALPNARNPEITQRTFQADPIPMVVVSEDFPILKDVALDMSGFQELIAHPAVEKQIQSAMGDKYDSIIGDGKWGKPFYFSYDETNQIYYAEGSVLVWEITQHGVVHIAFVNYGVAGEVADAQVWEFTNEINQQPGSEMKLWLAQQASLSSQTDSVYSQMAEIAGE